MNRYYYAQECIFDLIAASGPQVLYSLWTECNQQCNTYAYTEGTIGEGHQATEAALEALINAGLIDIEKDEKYTYYDLSVYGYCILAKCRARQYDLDMHNRATLG